MSIYVCVALGTVRSIGFLLHNLYSYSLIITNIICCCLHLPVLWGAVLIGLCSLLSIFQDYGDSVRLLFDYNCVFCVSLIVSYMFDLDLSPLIPSRSVLPDLILIGLTL